MAVVCSKLSPGRAAGDHVSLLSEGEFVLPQGLVSQRIVFPRSPLRGSFPRNSKFDQDFELRRCSPGMTKSWESAVRISPIFLFFPAALRPGALRSAAARTSLEETSEVDLGSWLIGKQEGLIRILV
jgi:hypothetical protein